MRLLDFLTTNATKMNEIERMFVEDVYYPYAGENGLDYLEVQTPFEDSECRTRKLDFTITTNRYRYVIEIDGYTYHAEGATRVSPEYFDDLLTKHNDLILNGYILIRFSYNQIRTKPDFCINTLRRSFKADAEINPYYLRRDSFEPTFPQRRALEACDFFRNNGTNKGVVILPTGMGKTILAAIDARRLNLRTLFVVHKNGILREAFEKFDLIWHSASKGFFDAVEKDTTSQIIFASKDTLYKDGNLEQFTPDSFDLIIIDEVHHSACTTYRKILDYFTPKYMLGLTATPERQDRADILELFDYNIYYELPQREAIECGYLSGFRYYGLTDDIDYTRIRHNGIRYDVADLGRKLNIPERNEAVWQKYVELANNSKALGFCVNIDHAITMASFFKSKGINAEAVHSDTSRLSDEKKALFIQEFRENTIQILFTVDLFNEGVDFPDVETLLFVRPTESKTIFIQQLGRGLRLSPNKSHVTVLDFIGNFKNVENIRDYLKGGFSTTSDGAVEKKKFGVKEFLDWPLGCDVHFDSSVEEIFKAHDEANKEVTQEDLIENYYSVKEKITRKPGQDDINNEVISHYKLSLYRSIFGSWNRFLESIGEATKASYHYPQGTHLGHIYYIVDILGKGKYTELVNPELYISEDGLSKLARQTRYKVWACMELGLLYDDRNPVDENEGETFTHLTSAGKMLFEILNKHVADPNNFYAFRIGGKTENSWQMINNEIFYNDFIKRLPASDKEPLRQIFFEMDAVKQMLRFLFHMNKNREKFTKSDIYSTYFNAPYIQQYFDMNGITIPTEEGAKHRLPFILNILDAFGILEFIGQSEICLKQLPLDSCLFVSDNCSADELISATKCYYESGILPSKQQLIELRSLFGIEFMTSTYFIKSI